MMLCTNLNFEWVHYWNKTIMLSFIFISTQLPIPSELCFAFHPVFISNIPMCIVFPLKTQHHTFISSANCSDSTQLNKYSTTTTTSMIPAACLLACSFAQFYQPTQTPHTAKRRDQKDDRKGWSLKISVSFSRIVTIRGRWFKMFHWDFFSVI